MKKKQEKSFLAIEFASSGVKLIQIKEGDDRRYQLVAAQSIPLPLSADAKVQDELWKKAADQLLSDKDVKERIALLAINNPHTCFSQFVLPKIPKKELTETLKWKMKDEMPFPPEEAVLDYRLFEIVEKNETQRFSALVTALPQNLIERFLKILPSGKSSSFSLAYVPFSILALPNAFSLSSGELVVVVDIGHSITEIAFYIDGKLSFLRKIAFGGQTLNQAMIQPLASEKGYVSLTLEEAEQVKREENLFDHTNQNLAAGKIEISKLHPLVRPEFEKLAGELERSFDYYAQEHGIHVTQIFLAGGTSQIKGLTQFIEQKFEISVKRIELSTDIQISSTIQDQNLDPYYRLIALVLDRKDAATSPIAALGKSVERFLSSLSYVKTAAVAFLVFLIFASGMSWQYQQIVRKTEDLRAQIGRLKVGFGESQKINEIETQINRGELLASAILVNQPYWDDVFRELAHVFPEDVVLTGVSYEQSSFVVVGSISQASGQTSVSSLLVSMEGPIFHKATLVNSEQKDGFINFTIRCQVK